MMTGIKPGMSRAEYDKIEALNISTLIEGRRSMMHLDWKRRNPETNEALEIGIATHLALYEPAEFEKQVVKMGVTRRGTAAWDKQKHDNPGKLLLKDDAHDLCVGMRDAIRKHKTASEILNSPGIGEMSAVWKDKQTGLLCKGMIDRFCQWLAWPLISDVKTCLSAHPDSFARSVADYGYHVKAAWYLDALNAIQPAERRFMWIAVEKQPPYCVAVYEPTDETLDEGRRVYRALLTKYMECEKTNAWTGYDENPVPLSIPKWAFEN